MSEKTLVKTVRGKRPQIFDDRGVDYAMAITMALAEEVSVLRDRMDLVERVAADKGVIIANDIENYHLDEAALQEREKSRQAFMDRLFAIFHQEASELGEVRSSDDYQKILDEIAER